ncbi:SDR family NAD(P)-dependent oxidoreductase [Bradyrhizobium guangzhouense]|uniref:SDR family NAD(P)-dependent oxidoreductase n=1 Tax=Bradyrhizobium guangzhouense TaxID=1325095 RepID=UPI001009EFD3|nr:SDR family NAD(P)-dependent oxidoreductase [Bradyrhizobium guangzhouense]RXH11386.1 SDR family oxidoreductase [Bradyrhizobium guangzhouense]
MSAKPVEHYSDLENQHVLVTGGASGIGADLVRAFHHQGAIVSFLDVDVPSGRALVEELHGSNPPSFEPCDLRDLAALRETVQLFRRRRGNISILINNAARDDRHALEQIDPAGWDDCLAVNLRHQPFAIQAVLPGMLENGGGSIINFGSIAWMRGQASMVGYHAAKAAISGMTRALAREIGSRGVRVNCVAPGAIETERQTRLWTNAQAAEQIVQRQALAIRLQGHHIASVVLFLASGSSLAITGQTIIADAGLTIN